MQEYNKKTLINYIKLLDLKLIKTRTKNKNSYYNVASSFDIETTSTYFNNEKVAFMYEWTFGFNDFICYGRKWETFLDLCKTLQDILNLNERVNLIIYVHNLSFEFQFMCKYFEWVSVFALEERKPIKALTNIGIEFRCSYVLSGLNLALTAKNLTKYKISKLVGDLNYSLIRHEKTALSEQELKYCEYDVKIVLCYIKEQIEEYKNITKIPLTNTGRVRNFVRNYCFFGSKNHKKSYGKYSEYKRLMNTLTLDKDEYILLKNCFAGGFTHANFNYVGDTLNDVHSIDFTSSYPTVMLTEFFPIGKSQKVENISKEELIKNFNLKHFNFIFIAYFEKIESTFLEQYFSEHKCLKLKNPVVNNGRIFSADYLVYACTDVDFKIISKVYKWQNVKFSHIYKYYSNYLPKPIVESILKLYNDKTTLKNVAGKENEYLKSKGMLNSVYGMCVTDIVKDTTSFDENWYTEKADIDEKIKEYNENKKRFLFYPWGVFVTAYARYNLWNGILNIGDDYIYSDTDSIKFLHYEKHKNYINWYNKRVTEKLKIMCNFYAIDFKKTKPKTIKNVEKPLGVWDYEGKYRYFKTLGAKRYIYYTDDLHITVAGLTKNKGKDFIKDKKSIHEMFNFFNNNLYVPANFTGKNTHTYIDDLYEFEIKDYQNNLCYISSRSAVHLEKCDFTLKLSNTYIDFLTSGVKGEKIKGDVTI